MKENNDKMDCPFCKNEIETIPIENILFGYPPYYCKFCDISFYEEEIIKMNNKFY